MSFLGWPTEHCPIDERRSRRRKKIATDLLELFSKIFPEVIYDLLWESPTINAQAWLVGRVQHVRIYGGLVRHPAITRSGLALMIAHETGHHLGGLPRDPDMSWITWQGQADYWAARTGMPLVFGANARAATLRGARQIFKLPKISFLFSTKATNRTCHRGVGIRFLWPEHWDQSCQRALKTNFAETITENILATNPKFPTYWRR